MITYKVTFEAFELSEMRTLDACVFSSSDGVVPYLDAVNELFLEWLETAKFIWRGKSFWIPHISEMRSKQFEDGTVTLWMVSDAQTERVTITFAPIAMLTEDARRGLQYTPQGARMSDGTSVRFGYYVRESGDEVLALDVQQGERNCLVLLTTPGYYLSDFALDVQRVLDGELPSPYAVGDEGGRLILQKTGDSVAMIAGKTTGEEIKATVTQKDAAHLYSQVVYHINKIHPPSLRHLR